MQFSEEIIIQKPLAKVVELADSPENMQNWQPELEKRMLISGTARQPGAVSKLIYNMNGRSFVMTETVISKNLPDEMTGTYEDHGMIHTISNRFLPVDETTTRWVSENEIQFKGFMKLMGLFIGGSLRKQSQKYMQNFKTFVESGVPVKKT